MALPSYLDPNTYSVGFNGNVELQCRNGTYPECRHMFERQLLRDVELGNLDEKEATKRLRDADNLWSKAKKDPDVKALLEDRERQKKEHGEAILLAAKNEVAELNGIDPSEIELEVVDVKEKEAKEAKKKEDDKKKDDSKSTSSKSGQ